MGVFQCYDSLEFNRYAGDKKIHSPCAYMLAMVIDLHFMFSAIFHMLLFKFDLETSLIDQLLKAVAQSRMDAHGATDNLLGNI